MQSPTKQNLPVTTLEIDFRSFVDVVAISIASKVLSFQQAKQQVQVPIEQQTKCRTT